MASGYRWRDIDHNTGYSKHQHVGALINKTNSNSKHITKRAASRPSQESNISYDKKYTISHFKHINNKIKHVLCERTILPQGKHKQSKRRISSKSNTSTADASLASSSSGSNSSANSSRLLRRSLGGGANEHAKTPAVYKFKEIYERHRRQLLRQADAEARRMREFHSRPVPNFQRQHKRNESHSTIHSITIPITPSTLKKSMETQKKLAKLREAHEHELLRKPKFKFNSTAYMARQPFQPKHVVTKIEVKPFKFCCAERAKARKKFNKAANQTMEQRYREAYMERMKHDREEWLKMRKMTIFKARPNPWRRFYAEEDEEDEISSI